jgi:hypothetical protein
LITTVTVRRPRAFSFALLFLALATILTTAQGCAGCQQQAACALRGPLNSPSNYSLRRSVMKSGLDEFCHQMTTRNAPLTLIPGTPAIGRFFPQNCTQTQMPNGDLSVTFSGIGYAWSNVSKKMTFNMNGAVQYDQDFLVADDCAIDAFFRVRQVNGSNFQAHQIEQPLASFLNSLGGVADTIGRQLVAGNLSQGFTVVRDKDGHDSFTLGILEKGKTPIMPYDVHGSDRITYENSRVDVHQNERDFIGPIEITDSGRALYIGAGLDGIPAIDIAVMTKEPGEASLRYYYDYPQIGPLAGPPIMADVMRQGMPYKRAVPVPKGIYYVVLDNSSAAGVVAPPPATLLGDPAATITYAVQIGDAP